MIANYHTHTWRCNHATGTERQYVENALTAGLQILGFSDHSPYFFPGDYYSDYRMYVHQTEEYFRTMTDLKAEYAGQIDLHIGVEAEYYPLHFEGSSDFFVQVNIYLEEIEESEKQDEEDWFCRLLSQ